MLAFAKFVALCGQSCRRTFVPEAAGTDPCDLLNRRATPEQDGLPGTFSLRELDLDRDLDLLHRWMNDPEVARYWKKAWPREQVASYLREQQLSAHSTPYV